MEKVVVATVLTYQLRRVGKFGQMGWVLCLLPAGCAVSFDNWPNIGNSSTGGRASASGGTSQAGGTGNSGGTNSASVTGGTVGTGGVTNTESTLWLKFDDNLAKISSSPNDSLDINGMIIAYSDGCATFNFDPTTRCVSGMTCNLDGQYLNWGMAVEFDFKITDDSGNPPNAKFTWNPNEHKAIGIAWELTQLQIQRLQLWVPNMADVWQGICTTSGTCSIDGPPDGSPLIGTPGKLYFNSMTKDTWGSGTGYAYSPDATYSLQFKIPTVLVPAAHSYKFCINQLGVIVSN